MAGEALRPVAAAVAPYARRLQPLAAQALAGAAPHMQAAAQWVNRQAAAVEPWQLVLLTVALTLLAARLWWALTAAARTVQDKGALSGHPGRAGGRLAVQGGSVPLYVRLSVPSACMQVPHA